MIIENKHDINFCIAAVRFSTTNFYSEVNRANLSYAISIQNRFEKTKMGMWVHRPNQNPRCHLGHWHRGTKNLNWNSSKLAHCNLCKRALPPIDSDS